MSTATHSRLFVRLVKPSSPLGVRGRRLATRRAAGQLGATPPGYIDGLHHTAYIHAIRTLKTNGQRPDLEQLLLRLVEATEAEATHIGCAVTSAYYRELARLYKKNGDSGSEHAILARFAAQTHAPGVPATRLVKRLAKLPTAAPAQD